MQKMYLFIIFWYILPNSAYAYIGPGFGAGAIVAIIGILGAILLTLIAIIYFPIKKLLKRKKKIDDK